MVDGQATTDGDEQREAEPQERASHNPRPINRSPGLD